MIIVRARSKRHLEHIKELFTEYATSLGFNLSFQDFDKEMSELPGEYSPPNGRLLLALYNRQIAGCVALRKISKNICEMKRLYVRSAFRGKGIGKNLARLIIQEARKTGYNHMRLDTVPSMKEAILLYYSLGFKKSNPYRYNPIKGAMFMELTLR
jgi:ribosomal protein S18 acetylase RimI-like enzyme